MMNNKRVISTDFVVFTDAAKQKVMYEMEVDVFTKFKCSQFRTEIVEDYPGI